MGKSAKTKAVSVVVPVYNSEDTLRQLAERLHAALPGFCAEFELILVNDGSRDKSWSVITDLERQFSWIRGVDLMRNYGQHNALLCGIRCARYEFTLTMDDDLQHPPEELHRLSDRMDATGCDVVYGTPQARTHGLLRNFASGLTKLALQSAMGLKNATMVSALRLFRTRLRDAFDQYSGSFVSIDALLAWGTTEFAAVDTRHEERSVGKSNYTVGRLITHALNLMTGFSVTPLKIASLIGLALAIFSGFVLVWVVGRYLLQGTPVPGFPFLASIIGIFSGAQLLALGVIGEYLARMHSRLMDRPSYAVRESRSATALPQVPKLAEAPQRMSGEASANLGGSD